MVLPRRGFLGALALAPAALAGCAAGSGSARGAPAAAAGGGGRGERDGRVEAALAAVRSHPLSAEAEPALVFRAAAARPGVP
jgi:hypothetical protein